jgi:endonuclease/exonuclease/phosphatase family metal-dependent hydrolase
MDTDKKKVSFSVASYNIHRWVGLDGRHDCERTIKVIQELGAQIIGLQEVDRPAALKPSPEIQGQAQPCKNGHLPHRVHRPVKRTPSERAVRPHSLPGRRVSPFDTLGDATGLTAIPGPTIYRGNSHYGNVLLVDCHITEVNHIDLSIPGREPRGAIDAQLSMHGLAVRVLVTHLGLAMEERRRQVRCLLRHLSSKANDLVIVLGDINEWIPWRHPIRSLHRCLGRSPARRTFPSSSPLLRLDRIWVQPREAMAAISVHKSPLARIASDHLPLKADIVWNGKRCA